MLKGLELARQPRATYIHTCIFLKGNMDIFHTKVSTQILESIIGNTISIIQDELSKITLGTLIATHNFR
jgi:hypothetical protein